MSKEKKKASDIFTESEPFIGNKVSFVEAFPQIEKISVNVNEFKDFWEKHDGIYPISHFYNELNLSQFCDCSESSCYGGGFSIGSIINEMVHEKQTALENSANCKGKIGSSKGRRCMHTFKYKIKILYKNQ